MIKYSVFASYDIRFSKQVTAVKNFFENQLQ